MEQQQWSSTGEVRGMSPAAEGDWTEPPPSKWPTVIGVISLIYGCIGLLCMLGWGASIAFTESLMKMGGMNVTMAPAMKITGFITVALAVVAGVIMVSGAVGLLRRTRSGVKLLKIWAIYRLALIAVGLALSVMTAAPQIQFQKDIVSATNDRLREAGQPEQPVPTDEEIWRKLLIQGVALSAIFAIYPVFIALYLSRKKTTAEVETWR